MEQGRLKQQIVRQINESALGWYVDRQGRRQQAACLSFRDYMSVCLYDNEWGYYRAGPARIGRAGDFYTSSAVGDVLAQSIARYALAYSDKLGKPLYLVEWGAGTGRLSRQIHAAGSKLNADWIDRITGVMVEDHPAHREAAAQGEREKPSACARPPRIISSTEAWADGMLQENCLVVANELLDAFPVHRVACVEGEVAELGVAWDERDGLFEVYMPLTDERIAAWLAADGMALREGQRTEIHADSASFIATLGAAMPRGRLLVIDYGHEAAEYAASHRMAGTLLCYSRHMAHDNPYERIGQQDITSHVPFTFIRRMAEESGWRVSAYSTQKQFLLDWGVLSLLRAHDGSDPFSETARLNRSIRQLLLSDQMSETFKVLALER
jgi:SAM-dependent MidA family methyltransferase